MPFVFNGQERDLSSRCLALLLLLSRDSGRLFSLDELSKALGFCRRSVSRRLKFLSDAGFIKRRIEVHENRCLRVFVTLAGYAYLKQSGPLPVA